MSPVHKYEIDSDERKIIFTFLIGVSWFIHTAFKYAIDSIKEWPSIAQMSHFVETFHLSIPSFVAIFGILYWLVDQFLWKHIPYFVKTPDLNGVWKGSAKSSVDNFKKDHDMTIEIEQTWTHILIRFTGDYSVSTSVTASMAVKSKINKSLLYVYKNTPKDGVSDSPLAEHSGTALLERNKQGNILEGNYYNGRGRRTHGRLTLEKSV